MMRIDLVYSPAARTFVETSLTLPEGSTVADALVAAGWRERFALDTLSDISFGIWNQPATLRTVLQNQNRVEVYRPLRVDPKLARRERFNKQGGKTAGLFASRRAGAKQGY